MAHKEKKRKSFSKRSRYPQETGQLPAIDPSDAETGLPDETRTRLFDLFSQITRELETVYAENVALHRKVQLLTDKLDSLQAADRSDLSFKQNELLSVSHSPPDYQESSGKQSRLGAKKGSSSQISQKLKTTYKAGTSKIVSSFKNSVNVDCAVLKEYLGHNDGVWDVSFAHHGQPLIATASADKTARVWHSGSAACLLLYEAHTGSVNSIRFHPTEALLCTASGDMSTHIWKVNISLQKQSGTPTATEVTVDEISPRHSPEPEDQENYDLFEAASSLQLILKEHTGVVIAAEWMCDGKQLVSASWDHVAKLWDAERGECVCTLSGHDQELTNCSTHPMKKLIITSSRDTTFRLCDIRTPTVHAVNVFQGHSNVVTTAAFTSKDNIVSASDDRTIKVWDLKNMRSALTTIRTHAACNRLAVSSKEILAAPLDNRDVRLWDLAGTRLVTAKRTRRQGHSRMVSSAVWSDDLASGVNLFTCGFDRKVIGWKVSV
ncbi:WD repeat-containing protein 37-like isoform X2 [Corticium candelabrum]|uniref:WD repeat-containing protein 37-like isoform X2 n=1 Tax=Corticium candelabrum TaxID=121492 RepID=UPI002E270195|nr:WD repeat-containing protein 37-like isoform X2 [Corticium candelabrum]